MASIRFLDTAGSQLQNIDFSLEFTPRETSEQAFACAIRVLRQNWRQGTLGSKSRGQVAFSNKKPWRQKGTGRARVSSRRSPLWRKGGIIFGPQQRVRTLSMNGDQRVLVFNNLLATKLEQQNILSVDFDLAQTTPSTQKARQCLKNIGLADKKVLLFITLDDYVHAVSFRNLPNVRVLFFDEPNAFDLAYADCWLFLKKDAALFKEMVQRWN